MPPGTTADGLLRLVVRRQRRRVLVGSVLLGVWALCEVLVPVVAGWAIDTAVLTGDVGALVRAVVVVAVLFTVLMLSYRTGIRPLLAAQEHEGHALRVAVARRALDPHGARGRRPDGAVLSVASSDTQRTAEALDVALLVSSAVVSLVAVAVVLLGIHVPLALAVLVLAPLVSLALQLLAPLVTRRAAAQQEAVAVTSGLATDLVRGLRVVRGLGAQGAAAERYRRSSGDALAASLRSADADGAQLGVTTLVSGLFLAGVATAAGLLAVDGQMTVGQLVVVVGLAQHLSQPVRLVGLAVQRLAGARASAARVADYLAEPPVSEPGGRAPSGSPHLVVRGLRGQGLDGLDLDVAPGELVAVVTPDPAGAATLLDVLAGRVPPPAVGDAVRLGGAPLSELDADLVRAVVHVEPHATALFEGTLEDALVRDVAGAASAGTAVDGTGARRPTVQGALAAAAADEVVGLDPRGLGRPLHDGGTGLSGGQRQRVGLARALRADPPLLVLHDPTTAVDAVTEQAVARGLRDLRHGPAAGPDDGGDRPARSTLVLTASPALLAVADRVVLVAGGRSALVGSHADLARHPAYREAVLS
ncbi:ABC transporter transmembrane domain-containing protein [Pseudokineococcus lusitanus]|uniref:Putative ABC transport system ATP-binding protein n=1 Tax=Pseudokineococcus lusitanus TaxID=763993 RepID=A0A3N1HT30_9ACTN|nr:ABC transporter ATP-binding protein [Pseudokineococcus lusitanus]ROP45661.1 putative ABC transport system ATP-binding protein [Pseudokineococcus lusitanus]